ncbi:glutaminase, partial [Borborobacter arsenicus]|uniref:glutaminase n=1 Tax=Borborobacter arsenicus TaxID=1851146 RepID=UPI001FE0C480
NLEVLAIRHMCAHRSLPGQITLETPRSANQPLRGVTYALTYDIGLPGKSGIGGGIVAVSPGKGGFGTFAPRLDAAGNSVKGQLAAKFLSQRLGMDLFVSNPEV